MKLSSLCYSLAFALATFAGGCAASSDAPIDEAEAEEQMTSTADLTAATKTLVGKYVFSASTGKAPKFVGLVLNADGSFFADLDKGVGKDRERLTGTFSATANYLKLVPSAKSSSSSYGNYRYAKEKGIADGKVLSLSRTGWKNALRPEDSYCNADADCTGQNTTSCIGIQSCQENICEFYCNCSQ
jgi:hypothetical protein